jgi:hypothetical protein
MQGQGFATRFNAHAEEAYRAYGIERITTNANIDVGGYSHARAGYDFADDNARAAAVVHMATQAHRYPKAIREQVNAAIRNHNVTPIELAMIGGSGLSRDAVWAGAVSLVLLLALSLSRARTDPESLGWLLLGLALAGAGLAVQATRLTLHPSFNHNDLCHVLLTAALWPFYRAGLRLR